MSSTDILTEKEFDELAEQTIENIAEVIDDADIDADAELNQGVLEITFTNGSKVIVNRHAPMQQIWVAAKSGGFHFSRVGGAWIDSRHGDALPVRLAVVVFEQSGVFLRFE